MAAIKQRLHSEGIVLPDDTYTMLDRFAAMLLEWNRIHNLTGAKTIEAIADHIVDALYPMTFIDPPKRLLDVGTGAGFPGLVLAIAMPQTFVTLCEPIRKRVSFLRYAALSLELPNVTVEAKRVETLQRTHPFDLITSRAVTDTKLLLDLTRHLADDATRYLFYKGSRVTQELENVEENLRYDTIRHGLRNYLYIKGNDAA